MKFKILFVIALLSTNLVLARQKERTVFPFPQALGLNTDDNEMTIKDGEFSDGENIRTDKSLGIEPRKGFILFSTESSSGLWQFPSSTGTKYMITESSNVLKAVAAGKTNFSIFIGTVDPTVTTAVSIFGDRIYFINTTDGLKYNDLNAFVISSASVKGSLMVTHKGRLWVAGVPTDQRTIWLSEYLNPDNFSIPGIINPPITLPARIQVQGSLDEPITALYATYNDTLMWFKSNSFGAIYGNSRDNFTSYEFSNTVGTKQPLSIKNCDGLLRWVGSDNKIWQWDGAILKSLTDNIETYLQNATGIGQTKTITVQNSASAWGNGISGNFIDTTTVAGNVIFTSVISTGEGFDSGLGVNTKWFDASFVCGGPGNETPSGSGQIGWFCDKTKFGGEYTSSTMMVGTWTVTAGTPFYKFQEYRFYLYFTSGSIYANSFNQCLGNCKSMQGAGARIDIVGDDLSSYTIYLQTGTSGDTALANWFTVVSSAGIISKNDFIFSVYKDYSGNFGVQTASSMGLPFILRATGTWSDPAISSADTYGFNAQGYSDANLIIDSITLSRTDIWSSTFIPPSINLGIIPKAWDVFNADYNLNGGSITFNFYTSNLATMNVYDPTSFIASQTVSNGQTPTVSTGKYVIVLSSFSRAFSTNTPTLIDLAVNWYGTGSLSTPSLYYNLRTYWGLAISSSANNKVLVYDRLGHWQRDSGFRPDAMVLFNQNPYFGNPSGIYQMETGNGDNGSPTNSYIKQKAYAYGVPENTDYFDELYISAANSNATLQTQYFIDGSPTAYNLANYTMNKFPGINIFRLPFPSTQLNQGFTLSVKYTVNSTLNWRLLNTDLYYQSEEEPTSK